MPRWMRLFASLLLAIALPSQAVVAATMSLCGPRHAVGSAPADDVAGHAHHAPSGHHAVHASGHDSGGTAPVEGHKCAACAVCAAAHGITPSRIDLPPAPDAPVHFVAVTPGVEPFVSEAPERPPRFHLA